MDSITHIALGACIGEAFFEKGFGKKAMLWGALAQSTPDIDFVASFWSTTAQNLLAHRGFTHSILFAVIIIPLFALLADKIHKPHNITFKTWLLFFSVEIFLHLLLDGFNNYGVGWLEPFSHTRFSFNTIYVADFLFSIWSGIAFVMLLFLNRYSSKRKFCWRFGIVLPFIYLGYCSYNKLKINADVKEIMTSQNIPHKQYFTTPTPLQNWLWYVVAGNDSGYYVGFRSLFDSKKEISFQYFPKNDSLLTNISNHEDLQKLIRFSQKFYTVENYADTLVFNDLRFGQIIGWQNPKEKFVFHYYLQHPNDNKLVVQRGRFTGWNIQVIKNLINRIKGN
jgi:inner membrane protein